MRIKRLKIHNYRSIRDLEMECWPFVTLLGPNNHGKSNLLSALEFCLSTSVKPTEQDFFKGGDNVLWVELTFDELTEQERITFKKYVLSDGTICIRKTAVLEDGEIKISYNGHIEKPDIEWLDPDKAADYTDRNTINETPLKDFVPPSGRLTKKSVEEAQQKYIEKHRNELSFTRALENGDLLGAKNVAGGVLPDFYLIPAVRDLTDEIRIKTTTTFGRLLDRAINEMAEKDAHFIEARKHLEETIKSLNTRGSGGGQLENLEKAIENELQAWQVRVKIGVSPPELERLFELGTEISLDDGVETPADRKGHGLQRATMFALLMAWAKSLREEAGGAEEQERPASRKHSDSVIIAMEEPELFLHPHAQRKLAATLRKISEAPNHQVFICTHSTFFVDLEHYKELAIITKKSHSEGSRVCQCIYELFEGDRKKRFNMAQWVNPDRGEMFFAKKVVFVEGPTEKVILPYLAQRLGVYDPDVSIIDCGSKYNLSLYVAIANAYQIPYLVIHDEDPLPDSEIFDRWSKDKRESAIKTYELNKEIREFVQTHLGSVEVLSPDFELASGVSRSQGEKKGKPLAALEHFERLGESEIPQRLKEVVEAAYKC